MKLYSDICEAPDQSNKFNLKDLVQDVCRAEMQKIDGCLGDIYEKLDDFRGNFEAFEKKLGAIDGDIGELQVKYKHLESLVSFRFSMMSKRIGRMQEEINELIQEFNSSSPTCSSSCRSHCPECHDLVGSHSRLSPCTETHLPREKYSHETACPHTPGISHCIASDSSPDTLGHAHISSHQTSTLKESFAQLLCQIREKAWEQLENSSLDVELSQALSSRLLTPELECHVEQQEGHIRIEFRGGNHPKSSHSVLILPLNFHSS